MSPSVTEGEAIDLPRPFESRGGHAWVSYIPEPLRELPANNMDADGQSRLILLEDGRPLGPRHVQMTEIQQAGGGTFNHWRDAIYFSTSDGSDPNLNGRAYAARVAPEVPRVIGFGSCHVRQMLDAAAGRGAVNPVTHFTCPHSTDEVLQLFRQMRGELTVPDALAPYTAGRLPFGEARMLGGVTAGFVEICSPTRLLYDGWYLHRSRLNEQVNALVLKYDPSAGPALSDWFHAGLLKRHARLRADSEPVLLAAIPRDRPEHALLHDIIRTVQSVDQSRDETIAGLEAIRAAIPAPICLVLHTLRFMPDGRPLRWPAEFMATIREFAADNAIPLLDPGGLVEERGAASSLQPDLRHYTKAFMDFLASKAEGVLERFWTAAAQPSPA